MWKVTCIPSDKLVIFPRIQAVHSVAVVFSSEIMQNAVSPSLKGI